MDQRQIIIGFIVLIASFLVILLIIISMISFYPSIIGLDKIFVADSVSADGTVIKKVHPVTITSEELENFEKSLIEKNRILQERDSLDKSLASMLDSIRTIYDKTSNIRDSIESVSGRSNIIVNENVSLRDSLAALRRELESALQRISIAREQLKSTEGYLSMKLDSIEYKNFTDFAKIYNNSNPADVARILEQIDQRDAARILKMMQARKAGKVIEHMKPENAAVMLLLGGK